MITKLRLSSDTRPFQFGLQRGLHSRFCKERYPFRFHCECKGKQISQTCKSFLENLQLFCPQTIIQPRLEPLSIQHQPFRKSFQNHPEPFGQVDILHLSCLFKQGAISDGLNPAIPQPISVTKNFSCGCCFANSINSST